MDPRPSSSRSSSSSSTSTNGYRAAVAAPKNIARLGKSTLGAPINIVIKSSDEFKVPSVPDRPRYSASSNITSREYGRRPLTMSQPINLDPTSPDPGSGTPSRLKRLSLLARSPTSVSEHEPQYSSSITSPLADENSFLPMESPAGRMRTSTDGSVAGTPRRAGAGIGIRSSISYSPARQTRTSTIEGLSGRSFVGSEPRRSMESNDGRDLVGLDEGMEGEEQVQVKGETLTERHAELLTAIAQKERRVNELKQELQTEQAALLNLKSRWSTLISSMYPSSHNTPMQSSSARDRPLSPTIHAAVHSSQLDHGPEAQPGFQTLLQDVLGGAPLVDPEVMEGGRRFLGNLMKTVGAAAGGTTPVDAKSEQTGQAVAGPGIDLSSLRGMFSWSSPQPPSTVRIRPSGSGSSIREKRSPPAGAADTGSNTNVYQDLLGD